MISLDYFPHDPADVAVVHDQRIRALVAALTAHEEVELRVVQAGIRPKGLVDREALFKAAIADVRAGRKRVVKRPDGSLGFAEVHT